MSTPKCTKQSINRKRGQGTSGLKASALVATADQGDPPPFSPSLELTFRGHRSTVLAASFRPTAVSYSYSSLDGRGSPENVWSSPCILSGGADGYVFMWSARPTVRALRFVGPHSPVRDCAWSSHGQLLASAGHDGFVRLWLPMLRRTSGLTGSSSSGGGCVGSGGENCYLWRAHEGPVRALAAAPYDDYLYTAGDDKSVKCWDLNYSPTRSSSSGKSGGHKFVCGFVGGHQNWVRTVAVSSGMSALPSHGPLVASGGDDRTVQVWDPRSRRPTHTFYEHTDSVRSVDFHPDGCSIATGSSDHTINVYDLRLNRLLQHYGAHDGAVNEVRFAPTGSWLLSASADGTAKLWDLKEGYLYCTLSAHEGGVYTSRFSDDSRHLVTAGQDGLVMMWRTGLLRTQPVYATHFYAGKCPPVGAATEPLPLPAATSINTEPRPEDGFDHTHLAGSTVVNREGRRCGSRDAKELGTYLARSRRNSTDVVSGHRTSEGKRPNVGVAKSKLGNQATFSVASSQNSAVSSQRPPLAQPSLQAGGSAAAAAMAVSAEIDDCPFAACLRNDVCNGVGSGNSIAQSFSRSERRERTPVQPKTETHNGSEEFSVPNEAFHTVSMKVSVSDGGHQQGEENQRRLQPQERHHPLPTNAQVTSAVGVEGSLRGNTSGVGEEDEEMCVVEYIDDASGEARYNGWMSCAESASHHVDHSMLSRKGDEHNMNARLERLEKAYARLAEEVQVSQRHTVEVVQKQQENWELQRQQQRAEMEQLRVMMAGLVAQQDALLEALRKA
ncbi:hypothetical protein, conserved [Trypanosoma brucei gambiense DAL972]|uniref:Uncharacterized protein n=1 Tax=Trypanosoma brucei gambiense (strain MHOM/CI/86/DAL972) TaxID=679716 RepID=D0A1X8_TRYB9|nr:hypothetical protein, conserved [Trypanosoma brucei gambiense DAL972]CBH15271.1 hypothetical protein, conserved [Trypanosoma brucei gambiense DAL972]|eukprot:XP_011777536.1 hypothetical protein, conserved [Trypanosoma brucei gambiense DAL972]